MILQKTRMKKGTGGADGSVAMPYYEKEITSGDYIEVEQFFFSGKKIFRGEMRGITPQNQAEYNDRQSKKDFIRSVHCNFNPAHGDMFVTLTFSEIVDHAEASKAFRNFELRAKRHCRKAKTTYKRLSTIEKQGKWHIHMVVSGLSALTPLELEKLWGHGRVTVSSLDKANNYKDLAAYLFSPEKPSKTDLTSNNAKQPRQKFSKRWSGTRNLKKPVITTREIKRESVMRKIPTAPKGCILLPDWVLSCDAFGHLIRQYAYIKLPRNPRSMNAKKRPKPPPRKKCK